MITIYISHATDIKKSQFLLKFHISQFTFDIKENINLLDPARSNLYRSKNISIHEQFGCCSEVKISADALRMRCRRLCERKPSGKFNISEDVSQQYKGAGEGREALEMALLECLAKHGISRTSYKKVKARHVLKLIKSTNRGMEKGTQTLHGL